MKNIINQINKKIVPISILIFSSFIGILIMEIGLRLFNHNDEWRVVDQANILRNFQFSYDISKLYDSKEIRADYYRNEFGLRDNCISTKDIEILTIGGSTTDQRYVPLRFTFQSVLEKRLKEFDANFGCVTNAGIDGHSTWGHLFSFNNWFPLIPELRPKYILLYVGINDANFKIANSPNKCCDTNNASGFKVFLKKFEIIKGLLPIYRLLQSKGFMGEDMSAAYSNHWSNYSEADYTVKEINKMTNILSYDNSLAFKSRVEKILEYISDMGAIPICVTQPHKYVMKKENEKYGIPNILGEGYSGIDYDYSIREINSLLKDLCGKNTLDLYSHSFKEKHFYDEVHTTISGSIEIGEEMATFIISNLKTRGN